MRNPETIVVNQPEPPSGGGFSAQDIYYVLFRHKWKILLLTLLGIAAGAAWYVTAKPVYVSEARLLIRYVIENRNLAPDDANAVRSPDTRGDTIINSELQMLTSFDLVREVVASVGATNIVKDPNAADPVGSALAAVRRGVGVDVPPRSSVLRITFRHPDPQVARVVLTNLVDSYLRMHARIHRSTDALLDMGRQVDQLRRQVEETGQELNRIKNEVGVVSLEETKSYYLTQLGNVRAQILETEAELAERGVALDFLTNRVASTASPEGPATATNTIPSEIISQYRSVLVRLDTQRRREAELLLQYTGEHSQVKAIRAMIAEAEGERAGLERQYPALPFSQAAYASSPHGGQPVMPGAESSLAAMTIQALKAKLEILNRHAEELQKEAMRIAEREDEITKLERKLEIDSKKYFDYATALERARVDDELSQGKIGNIKLVENATPPYPDEGKRLKLAGGLAGGGLALGLLLAFFMELYMDQTVRRPVQIERQLRVPLFLSMPRLRLNGAPRNLLPEKAGGNGGGPSDNGRSAEEDEAAVFAEALRDRLMMHFQLHGLNHKPKLVGITSCGHGAGVTTLATSLAASLSETGDGNVLYVDVNPSRGASAKSFQRGRAGIGLRDALEQDTRDAAKVQENLYVVSLADPASGKIGVIPKTLSGLVPRMKASDYDYIIFDLPPITQTSATAKVAGLLDMTFVVLESEKTQIELARKATSLLAESRANVAAVLNKHKRYLPRKVDTDL